MYRCCVIHSGIIRLQCRKVLLATLRMSRAQSHSSRAPDGVYIALWFLGTNNHPPLVKYKVSLKYHAKEIYHPLFRLSFLIFCFLLSTRTRAKTETEGRKNGRPRAYQKVFPLSLASVNSFWRNKLVRRRHLNVVRFYFVSEQVWDWGGAYVMVRKAETRSITKFLYDNFMWWDKLDVITLTVFQRNRINKATAALYGLGWN